MTYEGALLEKLAHTNIGVIPPNQAAVEIDIPSGIAVATADIERLELNWWADLSYTRSLGDGWLADGKTVALIVPGAVAWPHQRNVLLNPDHRDFAKLTMGKLQPVRWDERLFGP
jgi:RES domain-containing protein